MGFTLQTEGFYRTKIGIEDIDYTTKKRTKTIQYKYWKFYADGRVYSKWQEGPNFDYNEYLRINAMIYEMIKSPYTLEDNAINIRVDKRSENIMEVLTLIADDTFVDSMAREYEYITQSAL